MSSDNRGDSGELVTGIGNSTFYLPNPQAEVNKDRPSCSLQEPSEKFRFSDPVEVTSSPTVVLNIADCTSSLQFTGSRDSFASIASQDVNSLQGEMVNSEVVPRGGILMQSPPILASA